LQHRAAQRVEWDLHAVRAASPTAEILPRIAPSWGLRVVADVEERCPVLALPATWDEYLARLSGKDRHELKRKMRKLERELPAVTVSVHASAEGWNEALGRFLTLNRLSKVGRRGSWTRAWVFLPRRHPASQAGAAVVESGVPWRLSGAWRQRRAVQPGCDPAHARQRGHVLPAVGTIPAHPRLDFLRARSYKRDFGPTPEQLLNIRILP
jgi:hypothetical protein